MTMDRKNTVSVIICCYTEERWEDIREAIASVQSQTRPAEEIVLSVDNNFPLYQRINEEIGEDVKVVLNNTVRGLSTTRNTGIAAARGELIAFLDDDAVADPEWLGNLAHLFDDTAVVAAGGRAILNWRTGQPNWFPSEIEWVVGGSYIGLPLDRRAEVQNPHGHNMCFRRGVFDATGMFDCSVGRIGQGGQAGEEAEFCLRVKRDFPDGKIIYEPSALIYHKVPRSRGRWKYLIRRSYGEGSCKARIQQESRRYANGPLHRESAYLKQLLFKAIPARLVRFWRPMSLIQAAAIMTCVVATGVGYVVARWKHSLQNGSGGLTARRM
jgi:glycosyltransferase involved in cell wall biosynthesis